MPRPLASLWLVAILITGCGESSRLSCRERADGRARNVVADCLESGDVADITAVRGPDHRAEPVACRHPRPQHRLPRPAPTTLRMGG